MTDTLTRPAARPTLKLKVGTRKRTPNAGTPSPPTFHKKGKLNPGAQWSDQYKARMRAEMDALLR